MSSPSPAPSPRDKQWIDQIAAGDETAWQQFIDAYEGRLTAYVAARIRDRATAEDIVQETFVGFLTSLPNYDGRRPVEGYLFSICGYKSTDHLRRSGRRPTLSLNDMTPRGSGPMPVAGTARGASTIFRSVQRRGREEEQLVGSLREQIERWRSSGNWIKLKVIELLVVRGMGNKQVAELLNLSEQQVANYKSDFQIRTRKAVGDPAP